MKIKQLIFSVDKPALRIPRGASGELSVTVQNLTTHLNQVAVKLDGIDDSWVEVIPPTMPVFSENQAVARVIVRPPPNPVQGLAGVYPLQLTGESIENVEQIEAASCEIQVPL